MLKHFLLLFVLTNGLGLVFANAFLPPEINEQITQSITLVNDDKQDPVNSIALLVYILVATALLLVIIKFFKTKMNVLFRVVEGIAIFFITISAFEILLYPLIGIDSTLTLLTLIIALAIVILRNTMPENIWLRNLVTILLVSYIGALIGMGLGLIPIIIFIILLAIYDIIAVFKTKHMVTLAKAVTKKNLAFTFAIPTKKHQFELGTGDIAIPLALAASVMQQYSSALLFPIYFLPAILILVGSLVGLSATLEYSSRHVGKALPALPLQTAFMIILVIVLQLIVPVYVL
ncbi:hypothetical protein KJ972_01535 [Candidatus Micrarchaeota archaeon]|nr:hypothetical protein [Candidatus Micrarchaeota archaeon]